MIICYINKEFKMEKTNSMSDTDLIYKLRNNDEPSQCLLELVERHSGIYITMVNNYTPSTNNVSSSYKDELISDKNYYIYQAALKYDESKKTKFSTYLGNETRWMCLNLYNKEKNKSMKEVNRDSEQVDNLASPCDMKNDIHKQEMFSKIEDIIDSDPDSRISKIFKMRYIDAKGNKLTPWKNISSSLSLSIQGCINVHNKAIKKLKKEFHKEI